MKYNFLQIALKSGVDGVEVFTATQFIQELFWKVAIAIVIILVNTFLYPLAKMLFHKMSEKLKEKGINVEEEKVNEIIDNTKEEINEKLKEIESEVKENELK